jgi:hypothetical protein
MGALAVWLEPGDGNPKSPTLDPPVYLLQEINLKLTLAVSRSCSMRKGRLQTIRPTISL